jgi:hypothetical protein
VGRGFHLIKQLGRYATGADPLAFGFDPHGATGIELGEAIANQILKLLGAGLGRHVEAAVAAAAMVGESFEIKHWFAQFGQSVQNLGFAGAGHAAEHNDLSGCAEHLTCPAAKGFVAIL